MHRLAPTSLVAFVLSLVACGQGRQGTSESTDAAVAPTALTSSTVEGRLAGIRNEFIVPANEGRFAVVAPPTASGFDRVSGRLVPRFSSPSGVATTSVALPATADGAFRVEHAGAAIEVRPLGLRAAPGAQSNGEVIYDGVLPGATLLHVPNPHGTEEYLRFSERPESREVRYELTLSAGLALRVVDGTLEILTADGTPRIHTRAPWIVDARGTQRLGQLRVEGCAFDSDGAPPWGRPVTAPGADRCTVVTSWDDDGLSYPLLVDPAWTSAGSLAQKRHGHRAAAFKRTTGTCSGGCVLVYGGLNASTVLNNAELYDVATKTWATTDAMPGGAREGHTLTGTDDGRVLLAGGKNGTTYSAATYFYNPAVTPRWSSAGSLPGLGRAYGAAALTSTKGAFTLRYIWFTGGYNSAGTPTKLVDAYDLQGSAWAAGNAMLVARAEHAITSWTWPFCTPIGSCTPPAYVVVAGGVNSTTPTLTASIEYTMGIGAGSWTSIGTLSAAAKRLAAANSGGLAFFAGGMNSSSSPVLNVDAIDMSNPATLTKGISTLTPARFDLRGASVSFGANQAMFIGGSTGTGFTGIGSAYNVDFFAFTTATTTTKRTGSLLTKRADHEATTLPGGTGVLVTGGYYGWCSSLAPCSYVYTGNELFVPQANGQTCNTATDCLSQFCVDGYCCNSACNDQCAACNVAGKLGTCSPATGQAVGTRTACIGYGTTCGSQCDGVDITKCTYSGPSTTCSAASCDSVTNTQSASSTCNGAGSCNLPVKLNCSPYTCGTTACKTTCSTNADCTTGFKCSGTGCVPSGEAGASCMIDTDCLSPNKCVDGVCCSSASCPSGQKCNVPGAAGTCKLPYGAACTSSTASSCATGNCVDGVCCDKLCAGQCEACNVAGSVGSCIAVAGAPVGSRTPCVGTGACQATCNGSDRTKCSDPPGPSKTCAAAFCSGNVETPMRVCDGLGVCAPATTTPCAPYVCGATDCKESCTSNTDCQTGYFCDSGSCVTTGALGTVCSDDSQCGSGHCVDGVCCSVAACTAPLVCNANGAGTCSKPNGTACTTDTECGSAHCKDGVCCNTACAGQCEACDVTANVGTCTPVLGDPRGGRTACVGTGACKASCDGADRTKCGTPPGSSTTCSTPSCSAGIAAAAAYCDGAGNCGTSVKKACAPYICDTIDCRTTCSSEADCATGYTCVDNACKPKGGIPCTTGADCKSGYCADGVCCDSSCAGQCEACDVAGSVGKCSPVTGLPHAGRTACFDGAGDTCKALTCDGNRDRLKCVAFANGPEKTCGPKTCKDGATEVDEPRCDGTGGCIASTATRSCAGYACGDGGCKTACSAPSDCASSYVCNGGKCEPAPSASCNGDLTASVPSDKSQPEKLCAPFKCNTATGDCYSTCTATEQCAAGAVCDGSKCVPSSPPGGTEEDGGGCAASPGAVSSGGSALFSILVAVGLLSRRRR